MVSHSVAHPHSAMEVIDHTHHLLGAEVTIGREGVTCEILIANGLFNLLIPRERGGFSLTLEGDLFRFDNQDQENLERTDFERFFQNNNVFTINGSVIKPVLKKLEFIKAINAISKLPPEKLPPDARVILVYPTDAEVQDLQIDWQVFTLLQQQNIFGEAVEPELNLKLNTIAESKIITLTRKSPTVHWNKSEETENREISPLAVSLSFIEIPIPVISILLVTGMIICIWRFGKLPVFRNRRILAGMTALLLIASVYTYGVATIYIQTPWIRSDTEVNEHKALEIFTTLHRNIYRAFDFNNESDIYDVLSKSVDGPLLDKVYTEIYQSLVAREQGGAVARVKSVVITDKKLLDSAKQTGSNEFNFKVQCNWQVDGVVYHWGHVHSRAAIYSAIYTVAQCQKNWKITDTETLEQKRVVYE